MCAVRRLSVVLAGLVTLARGRGGRRGRLGPVLRRGGGRCAPWSARPARHRRAASPSMRPATCSSPTPGIAACSWSCPRTGSSDGLQVRAGHAATLAGGAARARLDRPPDRRGRRLGRGRLRRRGHGAAGPGIVRPTGSRRVVTVAGTGRPASTATGSPARPASSTNRPGWRSTPPATSSSPTRPTAGCGSCAATTARSSGGPVTAGHLTTVAGTGVCGSAGQGGPLAAAQLWNPVAVAVDRAGDLFVADSGDQSVLLAPAPAGRTGHAGRRGRHRRGRGWDGGLRAVSR